MSKAADFLNKKADFLDYLSSLYSKIVAWNGKLGRIPIYRFAVAAIILENEYLYVMILPELSGKGAEQSVSIENIIINERG